MQATFLLGPAGSGKTFRCLEEIRRELSENPSGGALIFIAPKQATFQLERQLLAGPEISGFTRLHIFSFERLAQFVLEQLNLAPPRLLANEGRIMVLRALLLRHEKEFKLFARSARRPGFAQELNALLGELQEHQLTPVKLRALAGEKNLRPELSAKLHDLALLLENYSHWLAENGLHDANCLLDFATEALRKSSRSPSAALRFSGLWLDGFAEMTPQEMDLLTAALPFGAKATLAFCLDNRGEKENPGDWLSIWNVVGKTFRECRARVENLPGAKIKTEFLKRHAPQTRFARNATLARLEEKWSQPAASSQPPATALRVVGCANPGAEAVFVAREILKFVRAGNRFRDCAVFVRNLESYHQPLAREFRRYGIPFFLDRREGVAHHPLAELTRSTLRTAAFDWRPDDLFAALKSGFCDCADTEIDRLENAALEFGWRGKKWREPLPDEKLERIREKILPPFEIFFTQLAGLKFRPNGKQLAESLRELWRNLDTEKTLERWTVDETEVPSPANRHPSLHATVFSQMNLWLDNLELGFPNATLALRDWLPILEAGLATLTVGVIPPVLDEVLIGAIDRARSPVLKFALVLGVNEGVFPATPEAPSILTQTDRDDLENNKIAFGASVYEQISREHFLGYIACTRAGEKLSVTFARQSAEGKALNASAFIPRLQKLFPTLTPENFADEISIHDAESVVEIAPFISGRERSPALLLGETRAASGSEGFQKTKDLQLLSPLPGGEGQGEGEASRKNCLLPEIKLETARNWKDLLQTPRLARLENILAQMREPDPEENLSPAIAEKLYGPVLKTSVSRLEEFAACPFRFFVRSGLHAGERKRFELDARERGTFQHDVLKQFHNDLLAENKHWRDLLPDEARERIGRIAAGIMENFRDGLLNETAEARFAARALTAALKDFVGVSVGWLREQNKFDPVAAELDFGFVAGAPALEIDLGGGKRLALQGRIDRVDLCRDEKSGEAMAIVLDYKSSAKKLDTVLVEHGIQLQLLAYLSVLQHWKNPRATFGVDRLTPAGVFYVNLRGEFGGGGSRAEILAGGDDARRAAYRHTGRFDERALKQLDAKTARDQFSYRVTDAGKLYANSVEALLADDFEKLLDRVEARLQEFGRAIYSGLARVSPYRKGTQIPCGFCDYRAACRIDPWTHQFRVLGAKAAKEMD